MQPSYTFDRDPLSEEGFGDEPVKVQAQPVTNAPQPTQTGMSADTQKIKQTFANMKMAAAPSATQIGSKLLPLTPGGVGDQVMQQNQSNLESFAQRMRNDRQGMATIANRLKGQR